MLRIRTNEILERVILLFLLIWGSASFFLFISPLPIKIFVVVFTIVSIYLILIRLGDLFLLYFINFINFYLFYGLLFTYNLPLYIVMAGLILVTGISFLLLGKKIISLESLYLNILFFIIVISELFLALSYWLINPLTRSLVLVLFIYFLSGFWISIADQKFDKVVFRNYLVVTVATLILLLFTVAWGR